MSAYTDDPFALIAEMNKKFEGKQGEKRGNANKKQETPTSQSTSVSAGVADEGVDICELPIAAIALDPDQPRGVLRNLLKQLVDNPMIAVQKIQDLCAKGDLAALGVAKAIAELADDIERNGLLQPIGVVAHDGMYRLLFGERRLLAHAWLIKEGKTQWEKIRARVYSQANAPGPTASWSENLKRHEVPAVVLMQLVQRIYKECVESRAPSDFYVAQDQLKNEIYQAICKRYKEITGTEIAPATVRTWLQLLGSLSDEVIVLAAAFNFPYRFLLRLPGKDDAEQKAEAIAQARIALGEALPRVPKQPAQVNQWDKHQMQLAKHVKQLQKLQREARRLQRLAYTTGNIDNVIGQAEELRKTLEGYLNIVKSAKAIH
jgi:hypothetical protein